MAPEANSQTFSFDTVAALVAALIEKGGTVGNKEYEIMASLDNSRSASSYEHMFRRVKARAKELIEAKGGNVTPSSSARKNTKAKDDTPAGGKSTGKRGRKPKKTEDDGDDDESPAKKVKSEPSADAIMS